MATDEARNVMLQARLSHNYVLVVCRDSDAGSWVFRIVGPCPVQDSNQFIAGIREALWEGYEVAGRHFRQKMIVGPRVAFDNLQWVACPL
jgi:hypothetical protein